MWCGSKAVLVKKYLLPIAQKASIILPALIVNIDSNLLAELAKNTHLAKQLSDLIDLTGANVCIDGRFLLDHKVLILKSIMQR